MHADTAPLDGNSQPADEQIAYDVRHAAQVLDLSERQVWQLVASKQIPSVKLGRSRRISRADLVAYVEARRTAA